MSKLKDEHLEQDVLIEYSSRFLHFYRNNKGVVWGTGLGFLLSVALIIGYFVWTAHLNSQAQILLGQAEQYYMIGEHELALYGNDETFEPGFLQIAENYSRTRSGNLATYYAAVIYYEMEQYDEALAWIERFTLPEGIMGVAPLSFHAAILSELELNEEAGEKFLQAARWSENESTTPYNLLEAAIAFETAGNYERALQQLETILRDYPDSGQVTEAQRLKGFLTARN